MSDDIAWIDEISWDERGLVPAVTQSFVSGEVLMLAYVNREALEATLREGVAHFYSRSRARLWKKGETSGNVMEVVGVHLDCDRDAVLYSVLPAGPACHTGRRSCFFSHLKGTEHRAEVMDDLAAVIERRKRGDGCTSYAQRLLKGPECEALRKIGEEAGEVMLAAALPEESPDDLVEEVADLWFHSMIVLGRNGRTAADVFEKLAERRLKGGWDTAGDRRRGGENE